MSPRPGLDRTVPSAPRPDPRPEPTPEQWDAFYGHLAAVLASAWRNLAPAARAALQVPATGQEIAQ